MGRRRISHAEGFQIIYAGTPFSMRWDRTPLSLAIGCTSNNYKMERGWEVTLLGRNLTKHYFGQAINITLASIVINYVDGMAYILHMT